MFENLELYGAVQLFSLTWPISAEVLPIRIWTEGPASSTARFLHVSANMDTRKYQKIQVYGIMPHPSTLSTHYTLAALQHCPHQIGFLQHSTCGNSSPKRLSRSECFNTSTLSATRSWRQWQLSTKGLLSLLMFTSNLLIHVLLFFLLTPGNPVFQTTKVLTKVDIGRLKFQ